MKLTQEQIKNGIRVAYEQAGHNAYFGNGFRSGVKSAESNRSLLITGFAEWLDIEGIRQDEHHWKCKKDNYNKKYLTSEMLEMYHETLK